MPKQGEREKKGFPHFKQGLSRKGRGRPFPCPKGKPYAFPFPIPPKNKYPKAPNLGMK
jgi:hypothetical protein